MLPKRSRMQRSYWFWDACLGVSFVALTISTAASGQAQRDVQFSELGLEITLAGNTKPFIRFAGGMTLIRRNRLNVSDPKAAGEFTAIDVNAQRDGDGMRVKLSAIYNDLSNQEWWKDKHEKIVGSYLIRAGDTLRPSELEQFGIEPFEMKAIDAKPSVLRPGEGPRITNSTALEVERIEKHLDGYRIWLKNRSAKNIVAYAIDTGGTGVSTEGTGHGKSSIVLASGATSRELRLSASDVEHDK